MVFAFARWIWLEGYLDQDSFCRSTMAATLVDEMSELTIKEPQAFLLINMPFELISLTHTHVKIPWWIVNCLWTVLIVLVKLCARLWKLRQCSSNCRVWQAFELELGLATAVRALNTCCIIFFCGEFSVCCGYFVWNSTTHTVFPFGVLVYFIWSMIQFNAKKNEVMWRRWPRNTATSSLSTCASSTTAVSWRIGTLWSATTPRQLQSDDMVWPWDPNMFPDWHFWNQN